MESESQIKTNEKKIQTEDFSNDLLDVTSIEQKSSQVKKENIC